MSVKVVVEGKNIGKALSPLKRKLGNEGVLIEMRKAQAWRRRLRKAEALTA